MYNVDGWIEFLRVWYFHLATLDGLDDIVRMLTIDGATYTLSSTEDLSYSSRQLPSHTPDSHHACNVNDLVKCDVAIVLD